jgi:hypothetical protein
VSGMTPETFVLLAWAYIGGGDFELIRRPGLSEHQCWRQARRIEEDRGAQAWCYSDPDEALPRRWSSQPVCAHGGGSCAWPLLPGRRRI